MAVSKHAAGTHCCARSSSTARHAVTAMAVPCGRESTPPEIAVTGQFAELCPASAKLMRRDL
jgi:hypothetical protein